MNPSAATFTDVDNAELPHRNHAHHVPRLHLGLSELSDARRR